MSTLRIAQFELNVGRARELVGLGQSIVGMTYGRVDATDLYRSGLVQAVAALDAYVHGVILDHAVDILLGRRPAGSKTKIGLDFSAISDITSAPTPVEQELRARTHIAERLSKETFQREDSIAQGFSMIGIGKIWSTVFPASCNATKTALGIIVDRRNQIVHSCDTDPLNPGSVTPLADQDAINAIATIDSIVHGIDSVV